MEYFNSGNVVVTDGRLVVHGTNYPIENINSFNIIEHFEEIKNWEKILDLWFSSIIFFIVIIVISSPDIKSFHSIVENFKLRFGNLVLISIISLIFISIFTPKILRSTENYSLSLSTNNGTRQVLSSNNHAWILQIQDALNNAIDARSRIR